MSATTMFFENRDLITYMAKYLSPKELAKLSLTNKANYQSFSNDLFWKPLTEKHFPNAAPPPQGVSWKALFVSENKTTSEKLIDSLLISDGWTCGGIIALQKHVGRNNIPKARAEMKYIKDKIDNHNAKNPHALIDIKALLNKPAPHLGEAPKTTMLDFANLHNLSEIKRLLKANGASETRLTSYCPGFWNKVNDAVNTVSEVTGLSINP